ncbi:MAG TPA: hypothetical protein VIJ40_08050 [Acidimicrobiales bacterium]
MDHELEAEVIIDAFNRFKVDYVVIGAFAAIAQDVPIPPSMDIDFYASPDQLNLERLSKTLEFLDAKIRVNDLDEGIAFDRSSEFLGRMQMLNLTCEFGEFDILFEAAGIQDFQGLEERSLSVLVGRTETQVASVEDIAQSKRVAGRTKDLKVLQVFEKFLRGRENGLGR